MVDLNLYPVAILDQRKGLSHCLSSFLQRGRAKKASGESRRVVTTRRGHAQNKSLYINKNLCRLFLNLCKRQSRSVGIGNPHPYPFSQKEKAEAAFFPKTKKPSFGIPIAIGTGQANTLKTKNPSIARRVLIKIKF